jgi:COP9 signalosome complex subunit 4
VPLQECSWASRWNRVNGLRLLSILSQSLNLNSLSSRSISDSEKLHVYVRIVRLLLEDEDSVQAETYYNRAALLVHSATDREIILQFKLCQARISDYSRKFLEAASRYHELSYVGEIDEEERRHML